MMNASILQTVRFVRKHGVLGLGGLAIALGALAGATVCGRPAVSVLWFWPVMNKARFWAHGLLSGVGGLYQCLELVGIPVG